MYSRYLLLLSDVGKAALDVRWPRGVSSGGTHLRNGDSSIGRSDDGDPDVPGSNLTRSSTCFFRQLEMIVLWSVDDALVGTLALRLPPGYQSPNTSGELRTPKPWGLQVELAYGRGVPSGTFGASV